MLSDLQLWGVDKVDGAAVTIAGQVVCTDSGRWTVQREFNRRMKKRFQELGSQLYNPMAARVVAGACGSTAEDAARRSERPRLARRRDLRPTAFAFVHAAPRCARRCGSRPAGATGRRSRRAGTISGWTPTWPMAGATGSAATPRSRASAGEPIHRKPHQPHYQSRDYNPLNGGIERWFAPVLPEIAAGAEHDDASCATAARCSSAWRRRGPGTSRCTSSASRRAPGEAGSRRRRACIATASTTCWCC